MANLEIVMKNLKYYFAIPDPIILRNSPPKKYDKAHEFFLPKYFMLTIIDTTKIAGNSPKADIVMVHRSP